MITKQIDDNSISVIAEDSDDLLNLRRIIKVGDRLVGDTTRVIKQEKDYSRPDKGERVKIRIALTVEKISLDDVLDRLRVGGTITESSNESVPHGSHHSFILKIGDGITISKKSWTSLEKKLLQSNQQTGFILVAIETSDCGIARLRGTHLQFIPNIYSGSGGKRYKTNYSIDKYFESIVGGISSIIQKNDTIVLFGPGETKKKFANYMEKSKVIENHTIQTVEGIDSGGEDGIITFTKSESLQNIMSESKLAKVSSIIDEIMILANKKSNKFTMGFEETKKANDFGAIDSMVFSDRIIQTVDEQSVIDFLNDTESKGVKTYSVDSTTDIGLRVTGLGGIVSILRFPIQT